MHARAADLIEMLGLSPHPEGGWYREVYRSHDAVTRDGIRRRALTSIYYLLEAGQVSRWHVVALDEVWHFYEGDPLALITWRPGAELAEVTALTPDLGGAGEDHEELAAARTLAAEIPSRGEVHFVDLRRDEGELLVVACREQRYGLQHRDPWISHWPRGYVVE